MAMREIIHLKARNRLEAVGALETMLERVRTLPWNEPVEEHAYVTNEGNEN